MGDTPVDQVPDDAERPPCVGFYESGSDDDGDDDASLSAPASLASSPSTKRRRIEEDSDDGGDDGDDEIVFSDAEPDAVVPEPPAEQPPTEGQQQPQAEGQSLVEEPQPLAEEQPNVEQPQPQAEEPPLTTEQRLDAMTSKLGDRVFDAPGSMAAVVLDIFNVDTNAAVDGSLCDSTSIASIRDTFVQYMNDIAQIEIDLATSFIAQHEQPGSVYAVEEAFSTLNRSSFMLTAMRTRLDALRRVAESTLALHRFRRPRFSPTGDELAADGDHDPSWEPRLIDENLERSYSRSSMSSKKMMLTTFYHYLMQIAQSYHLRRRRHKDNSFSKTELYAPRTINGFKTVSYRHVGSLSDWMSQMLRLDSNPDFAAFFPHLGFFNNLGDMLTKMADVRLPEFVENQEIHGFENCYVDCSSGQAFFYEDRPAGISRYVARQHHDGVSLERSWFLDSPPPGSCVEDAATRSWTFAKEVTQPDRTPEERLAVEEAARRAGILGDIDEIAITQDALPTWHVKYAMPKPGSPHESRPPPPLHIPIPAACRILRYQQFSGEALFFLFAMIGRMLLPVGTLDRFGTILYFSGQTRSGKSTLLDAIVASLFPVKGTFSILSSNKESKFGLAPMARSDAIFCDEVEKRPTWNMGEIKSMATGSWMSLADKNNDPIFMRWRAPVLMSSNFLIPDWGVGSNDVFAIVRRFAPFRFPNTIRGSVDPNIETRLNGVERGAVFSLAIRCYHYMIKYIGNSSFETIAPSGTRRLISLMIEELHPMVKFLNQCKTIKFDLNDPTLVTPLDVLRTTYFEWTQSSGNSAVAKTAGSFTESFYLAPLLNAKCRVLRDASNNQAVTGFVGIGFVNDPPSQFVMDETAELG